MDEKDRLRFIHDLYEFNDDDPVSNALYRFNSKYMEVEPPYIIQYKKSEHKIRKLLVEILAFVLMPNHFHLLLRQKMENGIIRFMQKLGTGYTMYFNQKYERVGGLFQGRYKAVLVKRESHFIYLPTYIHTNPLKIYRGSTSINKVMNFLQSYRWSSFPDYIGHKNFPSLTSRDFLLEYFGGEKRLWDETKDIVADLLKNKLTDFPGIEEVRLDKDFA